MSQWQNWEQEQVDSQFLALIIILLILWIKVPYAQKTPPSSLVQA